MLRTATLSEIDFISNETIYTTLVESNIWVQYIHGNIKIGDSCGI